MNNLDIFIDPSVNPDGSNYSMLQGGGAGQSRTMTRFCGPNNADSASTLFDPASRGSWGIDVNRGFSVGSLFDGYEGASTSCTSDIYAGPSELSQPEDRNEVWLEQTYPNVKFATSIHSSGGYLMWSPGAYKTQGREALPSPSKGWQEEFWAAAHKTITEIANYRGTVVTPDRTGSLVDVFTSSAGNGTDEAWYNRNIVAYDLECGARQFSPTSTSNSGGDPGFTPNFATEGRAEGQECADGMYGLMSSALDYELDSTPPVVQPSVASVSPDSISITFDENEPSDTYYTTDGSTPTTASAQYQLAGSREQEGETLTFTHNTVLKWFSVDPKGNTSAVQSETFTVGDTPPGVTINQASGQNDPTSASPIHFTVVFSEPVTGFATGDVSLSGAAGATTAAVSEVAPNDGTTYDVAVSGMTATGTVVATISAGVATDTGNNPNTASTSNDNTVTYNFVDGQLTALYNAVKNTAPGKALGDKVKQIQAYVAANDKAAACTGLNDFINLVKAQKGKKLTDAQAADFTAQANAIKTTLGC